METRLIKILVVSIFCLLPCFASAQTRQYSLGGLPFDGGKFAQRYNLKQGDFWVINDTLFLKDGVVVVDDPPIVEPPGPLPLSITTDKLRKLAKGQLTAPEQILIRAILAVMLDEINNLRTVAKLQPRTKQDLINALQNKIDGGAADK